MSNNFFNQLVYNQCGSVAKRQLLMNNDVKEDIVEKFIDFLNKRLERALQSAENNTGNKDPTYRSRYRELVRSLACVRRSDIEDFWFANVKGYVYERLTPKVMQKQTYDAYAKTGEVINKCLKGIDSQIAMLGHIKDLYEDLMREQPDYEMTIHEAIITTVSKASFIDTEKAEKKNNYEKDLKDTINDDLLLCQEYRAKLMEIKNATKSYDQKTPIELLREAINSALFTLDSFMKGEAWLLDLDVFSESLSLLFKLKWTEVNKLNAIKKASETFDQTLKDKRFRRTMDNIENYLKTYQEHWLYKLTKEKLVSDRMVELINNRVKCYY